MGVIYGHEDPQKLIADAAAALGEQHPVVTALRDVLDRFRETESRVRDLEMRVDEIARGQR